MIELVDIWFKYPNTSDYVLRNITLSTRRGEVIAIIGPNGSGKTTLLKIMGLIYKPNKGQVLINSRDFWSLSDSEKSILKRNIVYVHEKPILVRGTALDNVALGLVLRGVNKNVARRKALMVLETLDLKHLINKDRKSLSAGEAQLVTIARAIVVEPKVLLLDEPTANLDLRRRAMLSQILYELLRRGKTIIIATHDYLFALSIAKRIILLENGELVAEGKPNDLKKELSKAKSSMYRFSQHFKIL